MKKLFTRLILTVLCVMMLCANFVGCANNEYDLEDVKLPCYTYTENGTTCNYNTDLFYRNDIPVKLGDPTAVYISEGPEKGYIYVTGTTGGDNYMAYRSKNFVDWELYDNLVVMDENYYGVKNFWAPQYFYDPDARYEDYNIEVAEGEDGTGLYFLSFSGRPGLDVSLERDGILPDTPYITVTISKHHNGPFHFFKGTNRNGLEMDASTPLFNLEYINPETGINLDEGKPESQKLYKYGRGFIDQVFWIDPVTKDKYMFMARSGVVDGSNEIWGVKMKDWVTPDYTTVSRLTTHAYTKVEGSEDNELYEWQPPKGFRIDEGPFAYYKDFTDDGIDNGKYYMTFSMGGTSSKRYPVIQAIADSPLGPYTKIQPSQGGLLCAIQESWDMNNSGHHSFLEIEDELWIVYHSYEIATDGVKGSRGPCYDRVTWAVNDLGQHVMVANGPSKTLSYLPECYSGYKNLAPSATVSATNAVKGTTKNLNDGVIKYHTDNESVVDNFEAKGTTTITLKWDEHITARAIMVYNACEYERIFHEIDNIKLYYVNEKGQTGVAYYNDWKFDVKGNIVPLEMFFTPEELEEMEDPTEYYEMRGSGAAIMEFNEIKINKIEMTIKKPKGNVGLDVSEIIVLGKEI